MRPRQLNFVAVYVPRTTVTMKLAPYFAFLWLLFFSASLAISVNDATLNLNLQRLYNGRSLPAEPVLATIQSSKDVIDFKFEIGSSTRPRELILLFSDEKGLDFAVFPRFDSSKHTISTSVAFSAIPQALRRQQKITASLVLANKDEIDQNVHVKLIEILPSDEVREEASTTNTERYGVLPEIHHIFREDESTINFIIPLIFSTFAGILTLILFYTWASVFGQGSIDTRGSNFKGAFLAALIAIEHTFLKYYLGASIFTTLFYTSILFVPSALFGSKALKAMVQLRSA